LFPAVLREGDGSGIKPGRGTKKNSQWLCGGALIKGITSASCEGHKKMVNDCSAKQNHRQVTGHQRTASISACSPVNGEPMPSSTA